MQRSTYTNPTENATASHLQSARLRLLDNGYTPLPANGKAVHLKGWDRIEVQEIDVRRWAKDHPDWGNTGIRTGTGIVAVDIDVLDNAVADRLQEHLERFTPEGRDLPPVRFGRAPKRLAVFRVEGDFTTFKGRGYIDGKGRTARIEILASGSQFIAFGIHPDTGKPYEWSDDVSPLDVRVDALPTITKDALHDFLDHADREFQREGWTVAETAKREGEALDVEKALEQIRTGALFHDSAIALAAHYAATGVDREDAKRRIKDAFESYEGKRDSRWHREYRDIKRSVRTAFDKFEQPEVDPDDFDDLDDEEEAPELFRSAARWAGKAAPAREWHVPDMIPAGAVTLLYGDGGTGKSLIGLQLAAATAVGGKWLGRTVDKPGKALVMSAEDPDDELWRRLEAITAAEFREMSELGKLYVESFLDRDPLLATVDGGKVKPTKLYRLLDREIERLQPTLVVLDTLANLHAGNENDKAQAMQFVTLLKRLASRHGCTVVMLAHPSLSGMSTGTGTAGSVGWNNGVRSRLYLRRIKDSAGHEIDPDARLLRVMKANYGPDGNEIPIRWQAGTFILDDGDDLQERERKVERRFLRLLDVFAEQGRYVSSYKTSTYAPARFAEHPDCDGISKGEFEKAMERLFAAGEIRMRDHKSKGKTRSHIVREEDI